MLISSLKPMSLQTKSESNLDKFLASASHATMAMWLKELGVIRVNSVRFTGQAKNDADFNTSLATAVTTALEGLLHASGLYGRLKRLDAIGCVPLPQKMTIAYRGLDCRCPELHANLQVTTNPARRALEAMVIAWVKLGRDWREVPPSVEADKDLVRIFVKLASNLVVKCAQKEEELLKAEQRRLGDVEAMRPSAKKDVLVARFIQRLDFIWWACSTLLTQLSFRGI